MTDRIHGVAIVPGSFDPISNGHINIVKRAAQTYDKVYLAVMINDAKEYMFTMEQRVEIAKAALDGIERVEVISSSGYLWKLAKELDAVAIVKGVRNDTDREYELKMAEYNTARNPKARTILLDAEPEFAEVSSSLVRERLLRGEDISEYLPKKAAEKLKSFLQDK